MGEQKNLFLAIGLSVAIIKWSEVVIMYYCLGLYGQHNYPRIPLKSLGVVGTR